MWRLILDVSSGYYGYADDPCLYHIGDVLIEIF